MGGFLLLVCCLLFSSFVFGAIEASYENANDDSYEPGITRYISQPIDIVRWPNTKWFDRTYYVTPSNTTNEYARQRYNLTVNKGTGVDSVTGEGLYKWGQSYATSGITLGGYTLSKTPSGIMPTNTNTVTVEAVPNNYTVTFMYNDGTSNSTTRSVTYTKTYGSLPSPSRTNYTLNGWYTASSGGTKITSTSVLDTPSDKTLYAHWTYSPPYVPTKHYVCQNLAPSQNYNAKNSDNPYWYRIYKPVSFPSGVKTYTITGTLSNSSSKITASIKGGTVASNASHIIISQPTSGSTVTADLSGYTCLAMQTTSGSNENGNPHWAYFTSLTISYVE